MLWRTCSLFGSVYSHFLTIFVVFGGGLAFGSGSILAYDGVNRLHFTPSRLRVINTFHKQTSFAKNQNILVVTFNYRTNVFGFPSAEELSPAKENLGFLDQDLAMLWVQQNIAAFGGDPSRVTIMV